MIKAIKNLLITAITGGIIIGGIGFVPSQSAGYDYTVGIVQLVRHSALDQATQGFKDKLTELVEDAGKTIKIDYQDAQNDTVNCSVIANNFAAKQYDLIMANATSALQACYNATDDIPILGTSVTVYDVALKLENYVAENGTGTNVSGTSDLAPLKEQARMLHELVPNARDIGLMYCSSETNSKYQIEEVIKAFGELGEEYGIQYNCTTYSFSDSNDIQAVVEKMAAESDAVYLPTDNTVASNAQLIDNICSPKGIPIVTGDEGTCSGCGIAVLGIDYYRLGEITAEIAAEILLEGKDAGSIPIAYDEQPIHKYNAEICAELGIKVPEGYVPIGQ